MFPEVYRLARCYFWIPPVVTYCDSILSIMSHKFDSQRASISPQTVALQMFLHANIDQVAKITNIFM